MERWNALPLIVRQILLGAVLFLIGGTTSFWYSYRPLHGALSWKVESLEARLDERNHEFLRLRDEFERLSKDDSERIEPETLAQTESELAKTKRALGKAEQEAKKLDQKRRDANATADRWRKRYEVLRDQQQTAPAAPESSAHEPGNPEAEMPDTGPELSGPGMPLSSARPGAPKSPGSSAPDGFDAATASDESGLP